MRLRPIAVPTADSASSTGTPAAKSAPKVSSRMPQGDRQAEHLGALEVLADDLAADGVVERGVADLVDEQVRVRLGDVRGRREHRGHLVGGDVVRRVAGLAVDVSTTGSSAERPSAERTRSPTCDTCGIPVSLVRSSVPTAVAVAASTRPRPGSPIGGARADGRWSS